MDDRAIQLYRYIYTYTVCSTSLGEGNILSLFVPDFILTCPVLDPSTFIRCSST